MDKISDDAKDFILKLTIKNPNKRISSTEAINHPWLRNINLV